MKRQLSELVKFQSGIYVKTNPEADTLYLQVSDFASCGTYRNMAMPTIMTHGSLGKHHLRRGDVLFAAKGSNNFATVYEEPIGQPAIASSAFIVLRIEDKYQSSLSPAFLAWYLNHPLVLDSLKRSASGTSIMAITMPLLASLEVNLPPVKKQYLIVQLDQLQKKEAALQKQLTGLRTALIQHQLYNAII